MCKANWTRPSEFWNGFRLECPHGLVAEGLAEKWREPEEMALVEDKDSGECFWRVCFITGIFLFLSISLFGGGEGSYFVIVVVCLLLFPVLFCLLFGLAMYPWRPWTHCAAQANKLMVLMPLPPEHELIGLPTSLFFYFLLVKIQIWGLEMTRRLRALVALTKDLSGFGSSVNSSSRDSGGLFWLCSTSHTQSTQTHNQPKHWYT